MLDAICGKMLKELDGREGIKRWYKLGGAMCPYVHPLL
jgi:hypothetical protein